MEHLQTRPAQEGAPQTPDPNDPLLQAQVPFMDEVPDLRTGGSAWPWGRILLGALLGGLLGGGLWLSALFTPLGASDLRQFQGQGAVAILFVGPFLLAWRFVVGGFWGGLLGGLLGGLSGRKSRSRACRS